MNNHPSARTRIMSRLTAAPHRSLPISPPSATAVWTPPVYGPARLAKFRAMLEASHAEVHEVTAEDWPQRLNAILTAKGVASLLYAPSTAVGQQLAKAWAGAEPPTPALVPYDRPVEEVKMVLVSGVDAALTTARGGIAHTGSLVLWPTPEEPRLMSLLPPVHIALIEEATLFDSLSETITGQGWAKGLPTNAVLISGPSKTADIEQTLAYGVHGPKDLIVLVMRAAP
ncbi:L-lactate dehydrogenase complex protein LldG [uncultured Gammaproteobacteria bacterium]